MQHVRHLSSVSLHNNTTGHYSNMIRRCTLLTVYTRVLCILVLYCILHLRLPEAVAKRAFLHRNVHSVDGVWVTLHSLQIYLLFNPGYNVCTGITPDFSNMTLPSLSHPSSPVCILVTLPMRFESQCADTVLYNKSHVIRTSNIEILH